MALNRYKEELLKGKGRESALKRAAGVAVCVCVWLCVSLCVCGNVCACECVWEGRGF